MAYGEITVNVTGVPEIKKTLAEAAQRIDQLTAENRGLRVENLKLREAVISAVRGLRDGLGDDLFSRLIGLYQR